MGRYDIFLPHVHIFRFFGKRPETGPKRTRKRTAGGVFYGGA